MWPYTPKNTIVHTIELTNQFINWLIIIVDYLKQQFILSMNAAVPVHTVSMTFFVVHLINLALHTLHSHMRMLKAQAHAPAWYFSIATTESPHES